MCQQGGDLGLGHRRVRQQLTYLAVQCSFCCYSSEVLFPVNRCFSIGVFGGVVCLAWTRASFYFVVGDWGAAAVLAACVFMFDDLGVGGGLGSMRSGVGVCGVWEGGRRRAGGRYTKLVWLVVPPFFWAVMGVRVACVYVVSFLRAPVGRFPSIDSLAVSACAAQRGMLGCRREYSVFFCFVFLAEPRATAYGCARGCVMGCS